MNTNYTYLLVLIISFAGPFALSFDKKVAFYKNWKRLVPAILLPAALYITWDIYFTSIGVWGFNETYILGATFFQLPVEEVLFFFVIPYCCVFIYECLRTYFPGIRNMGTGDRVLKLLGIILLITGLSFYDKLYTSWTFFFCAAFIAVIYLFRKFFRHFHPTYFLVSYVLIVIPFLIVNGILTAIPIVWYNDAENMGLRIYTIPFEDLFYGMLLVMMNISIYEKLKGNRS